ncbi:DNA mismatch repair protein [Rhodonellum sp.]|uniref:MutS-related protein n=1 Tax=Rhodonellum sp. TaxID=2231180 RepID=UPI002724F2E2|nr:DNA mismatch repair protein [Rhodonellum sp.]MDO9551639.1 DNA mismatch repair protein [Rhodonellum sp.]
MLLNLDDQDLDKALKSAQRKAAGFSISRLFVFFLIMAILIVGLSEWTLLLLTLPFVIALFVYLILGFNNEKDKEAFVLELKSMEISRNKRAARELQDFDAGEEFLEKAHPFVNDLDLFGAHSLFQMLNHTVTAAGKALLVKWMKAPINAMEAQSRYAAIEELRPKEKFLENFEAVGRAFIKTEKSKSNFYEWLAAKDKWKHIYFLPLLLGPIGGLLLLGATLYNDLSPAWLGMWILLGMFFLSFIFKRMQQASFAMPNKGDLKTFGLWAELLEKEDFQSPLLKELQIPFKSAAIEASMAMKSLEQKSFMIQNRFNLMYLIFNLLFWLDFFLWWRLAKWKTKYGEHLNNWEKSFENLQVLVSLSAFSNEESLDGKITWTHNDELRVENITHPLILPSKAIGNDFDLSSSQKIVLLTGANMSGKTTFMRTLGINMVLANLGLPPFAKEFQCGDFQLFTSMRNTDNLGESVSSFYAELARIKDLLDQTAAGIRVFFLLDEILKGTNTTDRIMGSEALIRQLADAGGKGIISTHDIELSSLEKTLDYLVNKSFHSEIDDQEIRFDYKIKSGPCPSFNAHKLMELMGIRF